LRNTLLIVTLSSFFLPLKGQIKTDSLVSKKDSTIVKSDSTFKDTAIGRTKNVFESRIKYTARDSMVLDNPNEMIYLYGLASVNYETMDLKAGEITIDNKTKLVKAQYALDSLGNKIEKPAFNDGSQAFDSEKMAYNMDTRKGKIYEALTKQDNLLVYGKAIKKDSSKIIYVKDAKCIPCEYADAQTYFQTRKAKIIPDDKVVTGPVFLVLAGIPTPIGLPFGFFPSTRKRKSGVILPKFRDAREQGVGLAEGGYYWGINDYLDVMLTGDVFTSGTWRANINSRYIVNYKMQGNLDVALARNYFADGDLPGVKVPITYNINWQHAFDQKFLGNARFSASVSYAGGLYNKFNQTDYNTTLNNNINSGVAYSKNYKNFNIASSITVKQDKRNNTVTIGFPQFTFALNPVKLFPNSSPNSPLQKLQFNYSNSFNATAVAREENLISDSTWNIIKSGFTQRASITHNQMIAKYINMNNSISLNGLGYLKTTRIVDETSIKGQKITEKQVFDPRATLNFSYSLGLSTSGFFGNYYYKSKYLKQIRHRMDPTVSFSYTPYLGDKFYNQNQTYYDFQKREEIKYSIYTNTLNGGPGTGQSGSINFGLGNTLEAKVRQKSDTGISYKKISLLNLFSVNTSYNLFAKEFQWSPLNASFGTSLFNKINIQGNISYSYYGIDTTGKAINTSYYQLTDKLLRFTGSDINVSTSFDKNFFLPKEDTEKGFEQFTWSLSPTVSCIWTPNIKTKKIDPTIFSSIVASVSLTKNWNFAVNSGYNFKDKNIAYTQMTIARDLRCWQMNVSWIVNGPNRGYNIGLNLKNAMFQNFKIPRQRNWQDNGALQN
jgi:hypothetical protein